ncbi:GDP-D-glucose phosphorylase 1 [Apis mellifera caucasica]|uniref:GDP-D-glucose phosphorylase 1 n=1 Tax=Apis mellifera TaxID=7460 RepID=A0A7M7IH61_APIME|nr:GDP-D-glucose phosphorylase 1 [Apis mellifera]KAG6802074.1 GDP-D-glucose phosphorylase 1 [Apis mellifera caucasica]KAG9432415.1 GDP-D-glucose phosphorylase 1 [Apis mellifera carnica]|eukprot:XP_016767412.1 GDP-D-glucose phosphorylase 1 [Apis mellifera]
MYNCFTQANCSFTQNDKKDKKSNFDAILEKKWIEAQKNKIFRYILNIKESKILKGKYHFLIQLNIDRGYKRRSPEDIISMKQPFNNKQFNFTKIKSEEQIMNLGSIDKDDIIAINVSPIEYCHSLLLPQRNKQLPQVITKYSLFKAIELFSLSSSLYLRVAFNSLCAYASVNHLHWHLYYLKWRMLLEYIDLKEYIGPVQILEKYPAKAFCVKYSNVQNIDDFVNWAFLIINYLQNAQIAHNVYITRAKLNCTEEYKDLRIYIWSRKSSEGTKNINAFNPAACELFGHLLLKSEETYKNISEEYVINILQNITEETFYSVFSEIKNLIKCQIK